MHDLLGAACSFTGIYAGRRAATATTDADGELRVTVPPLSAVVLPRGTAGRRQRPAPGITDQPARRSAPRSTGRVDARRASVTGDAAGAR